MWLQEERELQQQQEERRRFVEEKAALEHQKYLEEKYRLLEEALSEKRIKKERKRIECRSEASSRVSECVQKAGRMRQIEPFIAVIIHNST